MPTTDALHATRRSRLAVRAQVGKALAHPTRLVIVEELSAGERCVCELTSMIGADTSTVSKHLPILKSADIVADDKRGTQVFCHLRMPCVLDFIGCAETVMRQAAEDRLCLAR